MMRSFQWLTDQLGRCCYPTGCCHTDEAASDHRRAPTRVPTPIVKSVLNV